MLPPKSSRINNEHSSAHEIATQSNRRQPLGRKVRIAAHKDEAARKARQDAEFDERYNRVRYDPFPSEINYERAAYLFRLSLIHTAAPYLSKSALSVLPALASRADYRDNRWFQVSEYSIGRLAGVHRETAARALRELSKKTIPDPAGTRFPLVERWWDDRGARHFYWYKIALARPDWRDRFHGQYTPFYVSIIDSGLWARLSQRAQAVYLSLRSEARFSAEIHDLVAGTSYLRDAGDGYAYRKFEVCTTSVSYLCRLAGVSRSRVRAVFQELQAAGLVAPAPRGDWLVFLAQQPVDDCGEVHLWTDSEALASKLADIVEQRDRIRTTEDERQRWAADIRRLADELADDTARIDRALDWYGDHADEQLAPRIDSGKALHAKWNSLETAMQRCKTQDKRQAQYRDAGKGAHPTPGKYGKENDEHVTIADLTVS